MLSLGIIINLIAIPLFSRQITPTLFNRVTCLLLIYAGFISFNGFYIENLSEDISIYSGLFHITTVSQSIEIFLFTVGSILLVPWKSLSSTYENTYTISSGNFELKGNLFSKVDSNEIAEYSLLILFSTIGASLLMSSTDLISMFLSIELQSFAVYVLATLYRNSESATAAGLKYFLLGGLSSALILLGTALIYNSTGLTQFEDIYSLISVDFQTPALFFGFSLVGVGFLFKVAAAPFHNWAPDVYDGTPTIVTAWLSTMPKISIFILLLQFSMILSSSFAMISVDLWKTLLLIASLLSLVLGTVLGLSQYRIKRLLTYSTISHVGFLLLALSMNTEESIESFIFYLLQYSITNANVFLILLALGYASQNSSSRGGDINLISQLKGQFKDNPLLAISFAVCLFSMAGIPPLIGFFAKQMVLYSSMHVGYYFMSIVAILVSVISASYYLKIVQIMYFENKEDESQISNLQFKTTISNVHSILIAILTLIIILFMFDPIIFLNNCHLLAMSIFNY